MGCGLAIALWLLVVTISKCSVYPITNPDPFCSHSYVTVLILDTYVDDIVRIIGTKHYRWLEAKFILHVLASHVP
jgi:hypothetical protein